MYRSPRVIVLLIILVPSHLFGQGVGINVSSPQSMLDVEGNASIGAAYSGTTAAPANGAIIEGSVGIGTSNPIQELHVIGETHFNSPATAGLSSRGILIIPGTFSSANTLRSFINTCTFDMEASSTANGNVTTIIRLRSNNSVTPENTSIGFYTSLNAATGTEYMRLNGDGNLGIGSLSPTQKLDVAGSIFLTGSIRYPNGAAGLNIIEEPGLSGAIKTGGLLLGGAYAGFDPVDGEIMTNNTHIMFKPNDVEVMRIEHTTNQVGVGTTDPSAKLDVWGGITPGSGSGQIRTRGASSTNYWDVFHNANAVNDFGLTFRHSDGNGYLVLNNNGDSYLENALVGIGTNNPSGRLHAHDAVGSNTIFKVSGTTTATAIDESGTVNPTGTAIWRNMNINYDPQGANQWMYGISNTINVRGSTSNNVSNLYNYHAQARFLDTYSGNMNNYIGFRCAGVIVNTPGATVTNYVGFQARSSGTAAGTNLNAGFQGVLNSAANTWNLYMDGTADNYLEGQLGIGTNSPAASAKVEISSTTGALLLPRMNTTERDALTAVNGMVIYNTSTNRLEAYENGSWIDL